VLEQQQAWEPLPGWYLDPADGRQLRFWDGSQWTQQVRPRNNKRSGLLIIGGVVAALALLFGTLELLDRVQERLLRPGLEKTLDEVVLPAELRPVTQYFWGVWGCIDVCPTLTRRYSSLLSREETHRMVAAELRRLGYQCIRTCGQLDSSAWVQPGKGQRSPELLLDVRFTADVDRDAVVHYPKDPSRPVHVDLSVR
jgi:hypothetical protein